MQDRQELLDLLDETSYEIEQDQEEIELFTDRFNTTEIAPLQSELQDFFESYFEVSAK